MSGSPPATTDAAGDAADRRQRRRRPRKSCCSFFAHLEEELDRSGFLRNVEKRPSMVRNLRNLFQRAELHRAGAAHAARRRSPRSPAPARRDRSDLADAAASGLAQSPAVNEPRLFAHGPSRFDSAGARLDYSAALHSRKRGSMAPSARADLPGQQQSA